jgi:hypothetical protein
LYEALIRPFRAAALLEERSRRITELEGEVEVTRERLEAAEAAAEAERAAFEEKSTKMKTMLQVCGPTTVFCGLNLPGVMDMGGRG